MKSRKRGQLFLIEVIIALSVMIVLIAALFTVQSFTPPPTDQSLQQNGEAAIDALVDTGLMYQYLEEANYSRYVLDSFLFDDLNETKIKVANTIDGLLPAISNFKVFVDRYNDTASVQEWEQIDIINFEVSLPTGSSVTLIEYYTPGFNGVFAEFTFQLYVWNEVAS